MKLSSLLLSLPLLTLAQNWPPPANVTGSTAVHDPSMCVDKDGKYWLFTTSVGLEIITSVDRKEWTSIGTIWAPGQDVWTNNYTLTTDGNIWAPDCHYINDEFWVYYAASSFGSQNSAIFLARSKTGLPGSWTNEGLVTASSSADNYNAIDPNLFIDNKGDWHLTFGSFWTGIKQYASLELVVGSMISFKGTRASVAPNSGFLSNPSITALAERTADGGAIEGSYLYQVGDYYYLFTSWDKCCEGVNSTYNIRVVRSTSVSGPFVDQDGVDALNGGGSLILGSHGSIIGPGGQSIFKDKSDIILVYHYYTPTGSYLGLNLLNFSSGWPVVEALT